MSEGFAAELSEQLAAPARIQENESFREGAAEEEEQRTASFGGTGELAFRDFLSLLLWLSHLPKKAEDIRQEWSKEEKKEVAGPGERLVHQVKEAEESQPPKLPGDWLSHSCA